MSHIAITGIGLLSCLGQGITLHSNRLDVIEPSSADCTIFPPFPILPLADVDLTVHVPKKSDQRQMERWQLMGVHAAGEALQVAGFDTRDSRSRVDMHMVTNGGGRDLDADLAILADVDRPGPQLNQAMMARLRPSYFLSQLPNLLAGNVAHVLGVLGAARTFMGDESAGVSAIETACKRLTDGLSDVMLVGAVFDAEGPDRALDLAAAGLLGSEGFIPGSQAAALVLECEDHAAERGAQVLARMSAPNRSFRDLFGLSGRLFASAASGSDGLTGIPEDGVMTTDLTGFGLEAQFLSQLALAATCLAEGHSAHASVAMKGRRSATVQLEAKL